MMDRNAENGERQADAPGHSSFAPRPSFVIRASSFVISLWGAITAFLATRVFLLFFFTPVYTDGWLYWEYAFNTIDGGLIAYKEVPPDRILEYPPLAYEWLTIPRRLATKPTDMAVIRSGRHESLVVEYLDAFRWQMFASDIVAFILFVALARRRRAALAGLATWGYVAGTTLLGHVLYTRLDLVMSVLVLAWAYALLRSERDRRTAWPWQLATYASIGLGVSFKLIPIVLLPLTGILDLARLRRPRDCLMLAAGAVIFMIAAGGPFLWHYLRAGDAVFNLLEFHGQRPLEIESLGATLLLAARPLGLEVITRQGFGSWNALTPDSSAAGTVESIMSALTLVIGLTTVVVAVAQFRRQTPARAYIATLWMLLALATVAKVLSVQYFVWMLPAVLLVGLEFASRREFIALAVAQCVMLTLTLAVFPYLFFETYPDGALNPHPLVPRLDWLPCTLLVVRNSMAVGTVGALGCWIVRLPRRNN